MENFVELFRTFAPIAEAWVRQLMHEEVVNALQAEKAAEKPQRTYTREQVAEMLHISLPTLWSMQKKGDITPTRVGRRVLFTEDEIKKIQKK